MKIVIAFIAMLALYQNWGRVESAFSPSLSKEQLITAQNNAQSSANITSQKVILYGTTWCGYCKKTRQFLKENNIAFTEFDIEHSHEGRRRYDAINGNGVPVLEVNNMVIQGYAPEAILAALNDGSAVKVN